MAERRRGSGFRVVEHSAPPVLLASGSVPSASFERPFMFFFSLFVLVFCVALLRLLLQFYRNARLLGAPKPGDRIPVSYLPLSIL